MKGLGVAVVLGVALVVTGHPPWATPDLAFLLLLGLGLEATGGTAAPAAYLALGMRQGAATAALVVLAAAAVRSARKQTSPALSVLAGLAASAWLLPELGPAVYLAAAPSWLAAALAGLALLLAHAQPAWVLLAAGPALYVIQRGLQLRARQKTREELELRAQESDRALAVASQALEEAAARLQEQSQEIQGKTEEGLLLEELTQTLARSPNLAGTLDVIVQAGRAIVPCQSVAVFLGLLPARFHSPHAERLVNAGLTQLQEPTVAQCWQVKRPILASPPADPTRLFPDEARVAVLPLGDLGVLYFGRHEPFTDTERHLLTLLAGQATLGIQSAQRFQAQQEALQLHAAAHASLQAWVERLAWLLERSRELTAVSTSEEVLDRLVALVSPLAPAGLVLLGSEVVRRWPEGFWTVELLAEVQALAPRHLLWEDSGTALGSLVSVPLGERGTLVAGCPEPHRLTRDHRDMLALEANQVAAHLAKALLQAQVVQSSKLAAIGQLAAGVAHELNTPLGSIVMGIDLATLKPTPETLQGVKKAALSCKQIVSKLLLYARTTSGEAEPVELAALVQQGLALVERQLTLDDVTVETAVQPGLVLAQPGELAQVVVNLLLNARDAGAKRIRISGGGAQLWVEDDGAGMDAATLERIFDPFFTTKPVGHGTGLGLTVSRQILTAQGGRVEVASVPGQGTRMTLLLKPAEAV